MGALRVSKGACFFVDYVSSSVVDFPSTAD